MVVCSVVGGRDAATQHFCMTINCTIAAAAAAEVSSGDKTGDSTKQPSAACLRFQQAATCRQGPYSRAVRASHVQACWLRDQCWPQQEGCGILLMTVRVLSGNLSSSRSPPAHQGDQPEWQT